MSTEMEKSPQQPPQLLTYKQLFNSSETLQVQIAQATARLGLMTGRALEAPQLLGWVQNLEKYNPSRLTHAFERVEREVAAFPAVSHIVAILDRDEYDLQVALVLRGIQRHGYKWLDRPGWREEIFDEVERIHRPGPVHPPEPAPEIPLRMKRALELFGRQDDFREGLVRLWRDDPAFWTGETERETGQHGRQVNAIDKDLFACWLRAAGGEV